MIELRVEDYCQRCPDFEAEVFKNYGGRISYTVVCCKYAKRCEQMAERLKKVYDDRVAPVKSAELCSRCRYDMSNDLCCGRNDCMTCEMRDKPESPTHKNGMRGCYCLSINDGDPCKYYTPIKEESNET